MEEFLPNANPIVKISGPRWKCTPRITTANIPTAWLLIIPIADLFWLWEFSKGVDLVTTRSLAAGAAFLLLLFLGPIGGAIVQSSLNNVAAK